MNPKNCENKQLAPRKGGDLWKTAKRKSSIGATMKTSSRNSKEFKGSHVYALERNSLKHEQKKAKRLERLLASRSRSSSLTVNDSNNESNSQQSTISKDMSVDGFLNFDEDEGVVEKNTTGEINTVMGQKLKKHAFLEYLRK